MKFLPGLFSRINWAMFGGRKFALNAAVIAFIGYCTVLKIQIPAEHLDTIWKLVAVYCTANVGKDGIAWAIDKIKSIAAAKPESNADTIAQLEQLLAGLKAEAAKS